LICHSGEVGPLHEITLQGAFALEPASALNLGQADAVLQAFITHAAGGGGRELVGKVHANLASGTADAGKIRTADRWATMANAVIQNRASLGGDLLSDQGSVALRAALLASVADDVRALIPFIHAPRPAGRRVIVAAAFLIGLRTGVTDMPWAVKRAHLTTLSPLIVALREAVPEERQRVGREFQIEPDETPVGVVLRLLWNDQEVACWKSCEIEGSDRKAIVEHERSGGDGNFITNLVPQPSKADSAGASISSDNATPENEKQNCIRSHGGRLIELFRPEPPQQRGVTMRCALSETDRLRKPKEILEAACSGGLLWRVGVSSEATAALYADLPDWPDDSMLGELSRTLEHALGVYLVKKKSRAAASPRQRKAGGKKLSVESAP
jgi:hypothetical protein